MECPSCHTELPSLKCPACDKKTPTFGRYCCHCGQALPRPEDVVDARDEDSFSDRILCSDGTCIGVINKDGVCSECGKPYEGEPE